MARAVRMTKQHLAMGAADANFSKEFTAEPVVDTPPSFDEGGALKMLKIISEKVRENKMKAAAAAAAAAAATAGGNQGSQSTDKTSEETRVKRFASADAAVGVETGGGDDRSSCQAVQFS